MIKRTLYQPLKDHLAKKEVSLIIGPRQAGKTTLMLQLQQELEQRRQNTLFLNLDIEADKEYVASQAALLKKIRLEIGMKPGYVFIDEIQRKANAGLFLKGLYDMRLPYKFVISGSGALELKENIHESLAGRKRVFALNTLSFAEFMHWRTDYRYEGALRQFFSVERIRAGELLEEYLMFGGYPHVVTEQTVAEKNEAIKEIYQSYLEKDIAGLLQVKKTEDFSRLVRIAASQIGQLTKWSEMSSTLGLAEKTVKHYFWYLQKTFIMNALTPYHTNVRKELTKSPLFYFTDLGLRNYILGSFGQRPSPQDVGFLFQNFVFQLLAAKLLAGSATLHFWRTSDGTEVDFVVSAGKSVTPVEVKYQTMRQPAIARSFRSFIDRYRPAQAYCVNLSLEQKMAVARTTVSFLPWFRLSDTTVELL